MESDEKGKKPEKNYKVLINGNHYEFDHATVTGAEILTAANLLPVENYTLRVKRAGEQLKKVEANDEVDLSHPGIEKFKALARDQTEG